MSDQKTAVHLAHTKGHRWELQWDYQTDFLLAGSSASQLERRLASSMVLWTVARLAPRKERQTARLTETRSAPRSAHQWVRYLVQQTVVTTGHPLVHRWAQHWAPLSARLTVDHSARPWVQTTVISSAGPMAGPRADRMDRQMAARSVHHWVI